MCVFLTLRTYLRKILKLSTKVSFYVIYLLIKNNNLARLSVLSDYYIKLITCFLEINLLMNTVCDSVSKSGLKKKILSRSAAQRGLWPPCFMRFLDNTQRRATVGRTLLDE
jgi:hypothetical protein